MPEKITNASVYVAGATVTVLGLTPDQWSVVAIIVGIVTTVGTGLFNAWLQWDKRKRDLGEK